MAFRIFLLCGLLSVSACAGAGGANCNASFAPGGASCSPSGSGPRSARAFGETLQSPADYCTAESGFAAGARGEAYAGVCSGESAEAFLSAYGKGERLNALERASLAAGQAASDASKDLWQVKRRIMEAETRRLSSMTPRSERNELNIALRALHEERVSQQAEVDRLFALKSDAEQALAAYRDMLAAEKAAHSGQAVEPETASFP